MLLQAPWGDAMKTLEALGAIPGGCKTKFHVIFLISKMEIMLLQSCCEKNQELTFGRLVNYRVWCSCVAGTGQATETSQRRGLLSPRRGGTA